MPIFFLKLQPKESESETWLYIFASMREYNALDEHNGWRIPSAREKQRCLHPLHFQCLYNVSHTHITSKYMNFCGCVVCELVVIDIWCNGGDICEKRQRTQHMYPINSLVSSMSSIKFNARQTRARAKKNICKIHQKPIYLDDIYANGSIVNTASGSLLLNIFSPFQTNAESNIDG